MSLPPLPTPIRIDRIGYDSDTAYTAEQMEAHAQHAYAEGRKDERERCAQIVEGFDSCDPKYIAAAIRGQTAP